MTKKRNGDGPLLREIDPAKDSAAARAFDGGQCAFDGRIDDGNYLPGILFKEEHAFR